MDNTHHEIMRLTEELKARVDEGNLLMAQLQECQKKIASYEGMHEKWRNISNKLSPGNVRAEKLRQMLAELDKI
jgi:hypothetical protein